jgi:glycosyltransferase involved in cell wall biosynthesis
MADVAFLTGATRPELLGGLFASLARQDVDWEWFIQLDGPAIDWAPSAGDADGWLRDERVHLERNGKPLGSGATRNQALMRTRAPYVLCVDDDDLLYPGSIDKLLPISRAHPECFGVWGRTDVMTDLDDPPDPDHAEVFRSWPLPGLIPAGTLTERFRREDYFAVHVGGTLWQRTHLVAVGGYAALPRSIDTHPWVAAEALHPSWYADVPTYRYLIHPGQMTQTAYYADIKSRVHAFTFERADEIRRLNGRSRGDQHPGSS